MDDAATSSALPRRRLGGTGLDLSVLGVGGWLGLLPMPAEARGPDTPANALATDRAAKENAAVEAVQFAVSRGVNYFDTAPMYENGEAERHLGLGLKSLSPDARARVHVSTKVGWHPERQHRYDGESVRWSLQQSLTALHADRVDIVHVHNAWTDAHMEQILGPGGAVEALEELRTEGVVAAISLGSRPHRHIRRAIESGRFDAVMTTYDYSPIRASAGPLLELAQAHGVGVINASPYVGGLLAGMDPDLAAARRPPSLDGDLERARALWHWARTRDVDLGAVAVQFSLRDSRVACTLVGPRDAAEVEANLRHATAPLPEAIWAELDALLESLGPSTPGGEAGVLA